MTIQEFINSSTRLLEQENGTARLDVEVLLCDAIKKSRAWLLAHPDEKLAEQIIKKLQTQLERRAKHEPLAYIRGKTEFYDREFKVNKRVLVPRPESEMMIDLLKALTPKDSVKLADIGSGSGALGITAALELSNIIPSFYDIDPETLEVVSVNLKLHNITAESGISDLLSKVTPHDVLLANLPYVPNAHTINNAAMIEPAIAIFGGSDGLDLYRKLFAQIQSLSWRPQQIYTESLPFQHSDLQKIAEKASYYQIAAEDFIQVFACS